MKPRQVKCSLTFEQGKQLDEELEQGVQVMVHDLEEILGQELVNQKRALIVKRTREHLKKSVEMYEKHYEKLLAV